MAKRIAPGKARAQTKSKIKGGSGSHMMTFEDKSKMLRRHERTWKGGTSKRRLTPR